MLTDDDSLLLPTYNAFSQRHSKSVSSVTTHTSDTRVQDSIHRCESIKFVGQRRQRRHCVETAAGKSQPTRVPLKDFAMLVFLVASQASMLVIEGVEESVAIDFRLTC
jgi:hypothetical protein